MRTILIDWMIEVCFEFSLKRQTLQMAVRYLDSFLTKSKVIKEKLQLVGVCTLMIASKIEEVVVPALGEFRRACDDGFSIEEICEIEQRILKVPKKKRMRKKGGDKNFLSQEKKIIFCFRNVFY